jgi:hypothetical protein
MPVIGNGPLLFVIGALGFSGTGCGIVAPSCVDHVITTVNGNVGPGQVVTHLMPYETKASQNDLEMTWPAGQRRADGLRPRMYATSVSCTDFVPPTSDNPNPNTAACKVISKSFGFQAPDGEVIYNQLTVTGPGNGQPLDFREYKLHVVGDPSQAANYSITATWHSGFDC